MHHDINSPFLPGLLKSIPPQIPRGSSVVSELVSFENKRGMRIVGFHDLSRTNRDDKRWMIVLPGYGETKTDVLTVAYFLAQNGFHTLRFDYSDHVGESDGEILSTTLTKMKEDILSSINYIYRRFQPTAVGAVGSSLASRALIRAAREDDRIGIIFNLACVVDLRKTLFAIYKEDHVERTVRGLANGITRFAAIQTEIKPFYLNWAAAWRASDLISIGIGASFVRGSATLTRAIFLGTPTDAQARITGTDQTFAYNLGLLVKPQDTIKVGLTYRGRAYLDFEGANVKFADFDGTPTNTKVSEGGSLVLPAVISAGINWQVTPRWSLEFVYDWTKWDDFKNFKTTFATPLPALGGAVPISGLFVDAKWKNTSTLRLGTLFHLNESWDLMAGIAVDETPIPSKTLNPIIPGADILTVNGGFSYTWRKLQLTVGYMAVFYKTRNVQNNVLEASAPPPLTPPFTPGRDKYETFNNFLSLNIRYRF